MQNPYSPPRAEVADVSSADNNSGGGKSIVLPPGIAGWSWGAFLLNWIWALGNKTYIGLLCLVPYVGIVVAFYIGFKGRELAWRNKRWNSIEHFNSVQRAWSRWALIIIFAAAAIGVIVAIVAPPNPR